MNYAIREGRPIAIETLDTGATVSRARRRERKAFTRVPLDWAAKAAKATKTIKSMVWIRLLHLQWETRNSTFLVPNGRLKRDGVTRFAKHRALRELEASGLIAVKRQRGKAPVVTIL